MSRNYRSTLHQIKARAAYLRHAHRRGGFGIHSPYIFHWLNSVLYEKTPFYAYEHLRTLRRSLRTDKTPISLHGFGTATRARITQVKNIARTATARQKHAELLFRIVNDSHSKNILELGTNLGLTTLHLAKANQQAHIITLEGEPALCQFAQSLFRRENALNIQHLCGDIDQTLPTALSSMPRLDLVFFDANHTYYATMRYLHQCLPHAHDHSIFVFDDIHRSEGMERAWNEIKALPQIRVTVDIFQMGIAFFNTDLQKENYVVAN